MKSQVWLLDPRPNLPSIVDMVEHGFALSEVSGTPVMLELRIRTCHVHGQFICKDNLAPAISRHLCAQVRCDFGCAIPQERQ
jgi:indolepyruvate ferredoxin oxidoreductase, alpha subunit